MPYIWLLLLFICSFINTPSCTYSQNKDPQSLIDELAKAGHRDIIFIQNADTLKIYYWPLGFRDDYKGFIDIKKRIIKFVQWSQDLNINHIELIQTSWGIPIVSAKIQKKVSLNTIHYTKKYNKLIKSDYSSPEKTSKRLMLLFDIPLTVSFGQPYDPLIFKTGIRPEIRLRLYNGIMAYGQVDFYFHNEYDPQQFYKPGNMGLMIAKTFKDNIISVTNIGAFHTDIYGFDEEIQISLFDDMFSVSVHGGFYGDLFFEKNKFKYNNIGHHLMLLKGTYSIEKYDCEIEFKGGQFLYGDKGLGFGISRIFKELEIGFNMIKTKEDIAGNMHFSIPIFPGSRRSLSNHGIGFVKHFNFRYCYYSNNLGMEPKISTSLRNIEGITIPNHFKYMSKTFQEY